MAGTQRSATVDAKSLSGFIGQIAGDPEELRTVTRTVNPMNFEVTSILEHLDRRREYPAVLFKNPLDMYGNPSEFPIVSNLWATRERCAAAIGHPREKSGRELSTRIADLVNQPVEPKVVGGDDAPVHAHVRQGDQADMFTLPTVRHFEMDLGGVLTMALAMRPPGGHAYNVTFIKTFVEAGRKGGLTIHGKDMGRMMKEWESRGEPIPVINILGHHPAFWLGTVNNTPYGDNEYATAGGYLHEPVRLVPSVTWGSDFLVPADAEIVIEGEITPGERTIVDPFGEISGEYQEQQFAPVLEVKAITHREDALFQDIFSGHIEHMLLGSIGREGTIYNYLRQEMGIVTGVHVPASGVGRYTAYVSLARHEPGQAKVAAAKVLQRVGSLRGVVMVDDDIDVFNETEVLWAMNTYMNPGEDVQVLPRKRGVREPRGLGAIGQVIVDATRPRNIALPGRLRVPPTAMERVKLEDWLDPVEGGRA